MLGKLAFVQDTKSYLNKLFFLLADMQLCLCNYFIRYLLRSQELLEATEMLKMRSLHESLL